MALGAGRPESTADVGLVDGPTDEQEAIEHPMLFRQADDVGLDTGVVGLEIHGKRAARLRMSGDEPEDLVDRRYLLAAKGGREPATGIEPTKLFDRQIGDAALSVGRAIDRVVVNADQH